MLTCHHIFVMRNQSPPLLQIIQTWYPQQTRKIKGDFLRSCGVHHLLVNRALKGGRCTDKTAKAIAKAFGYPSRWPELVQ